MTFYQIWNQLLRKCPDLARGEAKIEFTSDNLQQLLRQVYEQGEKQGQVNKPASSGNPFSQMFGGF